MNRTGGLLAFWPMATRFLSFQTCAWWHFKELLDRVGLLQEWVEHADNFFTWSCMTTVNDKLYPKHSNIKNPTSKTHFQSWPKRPHTQGSRFQKHENTNVTTMKTWNHMVVSGKCYLKKRPASKLPRRFREIIRTKPWSCKERKQGKQTNGR